MKHKKEGIKKKKLIWIPRILSIAYILFISLFALDTPIGIGFLIHLLPSFIFISCLVTAWFKPRIGGIFFILAGLGTIIVWNTYREIVSLIVISFIPILIGILFLLKKSKNSFFF